MTEHPEATERWEREGEDFATARLARDRAFGLRLQQACDGNPAVPPPNHGRQTWVRRQLAERFDLAVSPETVSKWFNGVARPRPDKIGNLASLLEVDEAWLALGLTPDLGPRESRLRNAQADGVVNVLAGFIQMCGGHPAFPGPQDRNTAVDLYAIIKGAHYAFHAALALGAADGGLKFVIPPGHEDVVVIGVVRRAPLACDFLELPAEVVAIHGVRRGGVTELLVEARADGYGVGPTALPLIRTFAERV